MKAGELARYIQDPSLMEAKVVPELNQLVKEFPYFQAAHMLLTLASKKFDASLYQQSLKKTAIVVTNRGRLFELISQLEESPAREVITNEKESEITSGSQVMREESPVLLKVIEHESEKAEATQPGISEKQSLDKLESEIERQVVTSFVEKELLRTPEAQKTPVPVSPPESAQPVSFGDWLAFLKKNNGQPYEQIAAAVKEEKQKQAGRSQEPTSPKPDRKLRNKALIDQIIEKNPGHIRVKEEPKFFTPESKARESLLENEHLVTETLARIYALQGNTAKAIRAYQILSLKNPQKSAYFAGLIQKLKNNDKTE